MGQNDKKSRCMYGPLARSFAHLLAPLTTKSFNKKDALIKLNFDNLPVVGETKLKKQLKALVFSFHLRGRAAL